MLLSSSGSVTSSFTIIVSKKVMIPHNSLMITSITVQDIPVTATGLLVASIINGIEGVWIEVVYHNALRLLTITWTISTSI